jgi:hypothetical protein
VIGLYNALRAQISAPVPEVDEVEIGAFFDFVRDTIVPELLELRPGGSMQDALSAMADTARAAVAALARRVRELEDLAKIDEAFSRLTVAQRDAANGALIAVREERDSSGRKLHEEGKRLVAAIAERDAAVARGMAMEAVLRSAEWQGAGTWNNGDELLRTCPTCEGIEPEHEDECSLAAALASRPPQPSPAPKAAGTGDGNGRDTCQRSLHVWENPEGKIACIHCGAEMDMKTYEAKAPKRARAALASSGTTSTTPDPLKTT